MEKLKRPRNLRSDKFNESRDLQNREEEKFRTVRLDSSILSKKKSITSEIQFAYVSYLVDFYFFLAEIKQSWCK